MIFTGAIAFTLVSSIRRASRLAVCAFPPILKNFHLLRRPTSSPISVVAVGTTTTRALEAAADAPGVVRAGAGVADVFIYPGFEFKVVDALLTNFHLPKSSLLMLVSAFAGRDLTLAAYRHAVREAFHFYSYGDAMLIL